MDIKGLKKLRRFLKNLPDESFDWYAFNSTDWHEDMTDESYNKEMKKHMKRIAKTLKPECGTVGCIAGWAAYTHPKRLKFNKYGVLVHRIWGELEEAAAFREAFGLTKNQADAVVYGFNKGYINSKAGAIQCLTDLIENKDARNGI